MKFWQAMKIVDEGGKVRRKVWRLKNYIYSSNNEINIHWAHTEKEESYLDLPSYFLKDDMLADDWEKFYYNANDPKNPLNIDEVRSPDEYPLYKENN